MSARRRVSKQMCSSAAEVLLLILLVTNSWFCVEADETPCLLEKEEDTCTEKVLVALFSSPVNFFSSQPLLLFCELCLENLSSKEAPPVPL